MQIVIEIPKKWFNDMVREEFIEVDELCAIIQHSTVLPDNHGKLIDIESIPIGDRNIIIKNELDPQTSAYVGSITLYDYINNLPTVLDAVKENI